MYKNSSSLTSSCVSDNFFGYILYVINLSLEKIGRGPEHGFSHCNWLSEAKQNSIFHHYFRCTEHCMNFQQTNFISLRQPLLRGSPASQVSSQSVKIWTCVLEKDKIENMVLKIDT